MNLGIYEQTFCESELTFWTTLARRLTSDRYGEKELSWLIEYECATRRRPHVIRRLVGRYFKLIRKRIEKELINDTRSCDRGVLEEKSKVIGWSSS